MKTFSAALLAAALAAPGAAPAPGAKQSKPAQETRQTAAPEVSKRGAPLGDSPLVAFADVFKEPQKYAGKRIRIEGVVERVCQAEGCWMQITPEGETDVAVRVTFDHKFSVPKDAGKMKFRAEGEFAVKTLSKETVEHLVRDDGAKIRTNPDGTAHEVSFVATGVELWK
ncbi:MAG: DUF4920 domain-containing protein [Acidobacteriota bacterium]|nr:DUF4920 domain-containing protein [Acidobacteriota bacterium]